MPLQVARVTPPDQASPAATVVSKVEQARYDRSKGLLELRLQLRNGGANEVRLTQIQIAELLLPVEGAPLVTPGQSERFTYKVDGKLLREHNLLPLQEPQVRITALLFFSDGQLNEIDELTSPILPR